MELESAKNKPLGSGSSGHFRFGKPLTLQQRRDLRRNIPLFAMLGPVLVYYLVFRYVPMGGILMAFEQYNFRQGIFGSPFVGMQNYVELFRQPNILNIIRNTAMLSVLSLVVGFPIPIIIALMLNEIRVRIYKNFVQTLIYMPHFFSWVIVGAMVVSLFSVDGGPINKVLLAATGHTYIFLYHPVSWIAIYLGAGVWKEAGFGTIIYLAALTSVDVGLYESAVLDGANKFQQIKSVTIPSILPTICIMLILATGHLMEVGFDEVYILSNSAVSTVAEVISTYIFRFGIEGAQFSYGTAIGLFDSLIGLVLIYTSNRIARKFGMSLW